MADFKKCLAFLFSKEFASTKDALAVDTHDRGGMTYKGIARRYHPEWSGWKIIDGILAKHPDIREASQVCFKNTALDAAVELFYRVEFWSPIHGEDIMYQATATEMFISAVNTGAGTAVKLAQQAAGVKVDGVFGMKTLTAVNALTPDVFCDRYTQHEIGHYEAIANDGKHDADDKRFIKGWIARAHAVDGNNALKIA